jgi:hypothetical protein
MLRAYAKGLLWFALVALALAGQAQAAAIVESLTGEASAGPSLTRTTPIAKGQRIDSGNYVVTGAKSLVVLGFDDGQKMALAENTQFRITSYSFKQDEPKKDKFSFDLLKGALRAVTSLFARRNPNAYALRTPQATIGIRGTDFMVAVVNPAYVTIANGTVNITTAAGSVSFGAGSTVTVTVPGALPVSIPFSQLPPNVQAVFQQLQALALTGGTAGVNATEAASGGVSGGAAAAAAAVAIGAAIAAGSGGDGGNGTSGTTGTTK